ncbi:sialate O-acetylesterase [Algibacter lectus]|nr:sialate O-acetylesterase [Algibacter lectus]
MHYFLNSRFSIFVCLVFTLFHIHCISQDQSNNTVQVVLLGGQSNMAGAGNFDELDENNIKRIEKIADRVSLSFNGKPAKPLSYFDNKPTEKYKFLKRFGPEVFMGGLTLAEANPTKHYLLIKRSQGGTALYGAWNPDWTAEKAKAVEKEPKQNLKLYSAHIADIKDNLKQLEKQGKSHRVIGMAWMQGENDAAREVSARTYNQNLKKLIHSYRFEFNIEEMPFIVGQINSRYGNFDGGPDMVRAAMENVANSDENVAIIKTSTDTSWSDFPKHTDNVHYNTEGQKRLGVAFANALMNLQKH